ncbi:Interferon-induced transmembrane protein 3 [Saguinus oedipus]|uniref:Interferon-induced transmembrane protein 3 n=1 Tax=Saguinus oedipus TaxID=9490 RepID=A0ABQ9TQE6_SAGOE|nr:Interferon-induced transmembrane protein 3 [Saguinus oedipus]
MLKREHEVALLGAPHNPATPPPPPSAAGPPSVQHSLDELCCLGFMVFAYSVRSMDRKMVGDLTGAQAYTSTAKCLNVWALI